MDKTQKTLSSAMLFVCMRCMLAILFIVSALGKLYATAFYFGWAYESMAPEWLLVVIALCEIILAYFLLFSEFQILSWLLGLTFFSVGLCWNMIATIVAVDCGCYGLLDVNTASKVAIYFSAATGLFILRPRSLAKIRTELKYWTLKTFNLKSLTSFCISLSTILICASFLATNAGRDLVGFIPPHNFAKVSLDVLPCSSLGSFEQSITYYVKESFNSSPKMTIYGEAK